MSTETQVQKRTAGEVGRTEQTWSGRYYAPTVDIAETKDELTVYADMPGVSADDLDVRFENGELRIHGRVKPRQDENVSYLLNEYALGDFFRTFQISETIDSEKISAEYRDGVLVLHLPKVERARPRKISVKTK
jgi:HSP20 family protein